MTWAYLPVHLWCWVTFWCSQIALLFFRNLGDDIATFFKEFSLESFMVQICISYMNKAKASHFSSQKRQFSRIFCSRSFRRTCCPPFRINAFVTESQDSVVKVSLGCDAHPMKFCNKSLLEKKVHITGKTSNHFFIDNMQSTSCMLQVAFFGYRKYTNKLFFG